MNTYIITTQIFNQIKYDLKGHLRSHQVICVFEGVRKMIKIKGQYDLKQKLLVE